ncbi:hypothetical protein [Desulfovibrio desulfuricans]|uniref:hypothetical protein n=1 Tax=Desulfovibrio desulfuricans TaxID=876 RepID=UPI0003B77ABC|nr:hypothetical protein [Desulfovibrio desulfuricans]
MHDKEYLAAAARMIAQQLADNPTILSIEADPDVADYMGAFTEDSIALADMIEDALLTVNGQGEVIYEG